MADTKDLKSFDSKNREGSTPSSGTAIVSDRLKVHLCRNAPWNKPKFVSPMFKRCPYCGDNL